MILAQRRFSDSDQRRFAAVSGDRNPMHMDAVAARRTEAGAPVVHGIHLLLWTLDALAAARPGLPLFRSLRAQFQRFVYVGESVAAVLTEERADGARVSIRVGNGARSKIRVDWGESREGSLHRGAGEVEQIPFTETALQPEFGRLLGYAGRVGWRMTDDEARTLFPRATTWLGARRVAALAASSYVVGMVCPGRYSMYSELAVTTCPELAGPEASGEDGFAFRVTEADPRFRAMEQEIVGGGLSGRIRCFALQPPVAQAGMEALARVVAPGEFAGSVALVVGGSRGLGELTAKLLAAGGGRVTVTWRTGREDAERVAAEIRGSGGACEVLAYDAGRPATEQLEGLTETPTHAYYFATPGIFRPQAEVFDADRLREFLGIYVDGFWEFAQAMRARAPGLSLFYPSSVAVTERPAGMAEYAMAKAAGEVLCAEINQAWAPCTITVRRLPRLATDQTAKLAMAETASAVDTMLPIIREVQARRR